MNDKLKLRGEQLVNLGHNTSVLSICAFLKHNEAMKVLLAARADVGAKVGLENFSFCSCSMQPTLETCRNTAVACDALCKDSYGGTAMHRASSGNNQEGACGLAFVRSQGMSHGFCCSSGCRYSDPTCTWCKCHGASHDGPFAIFVHDTWRDRWNGRSQGQLM